MKNDLDKIEFPKILVVSNNCLVIQIKMVRHWHHFLRITQQIKLHSYILVQRYLA